MNELIPISDNDGKKAVNARELHVFLESKQKFTDWIKNRIEKYDLVENVDFVTASQIYETVNGGHSTRIEYALSIDAAKELSMVEGNEKGKQARRYFISCEKKLKDPAALSPAEFLLQQAQFMVEKERQIKALENKVAEIEQRTTTDLKRSTVVAYVSRNGIQLDVKRYGAIGIKASNLCKKRGIEVSRVNDVRWGSVKVYPDEILDEVFANENKRKG